MLSATMLSLTRAIASRIPLASFKYVAPITIHRSPFVSGLLAYRVLSTAPPLLAAVRAKAKSTSGRTKAKPRTAVKARPKRAKAKPKAKPKAKTKAKVKRAAAKPKVSTRTYLNHPPTVI